VSQSDELQRYHPRIPAKSCQTPPKPAAGSGGVPHGHPTPVYCGRVFNTGGSAAHPGSVPILKTKADPRPDFESSTCSSRRFRIRAPSPPHVAGGTPVDPAAGVDGFWRFLAGGPGMMPLELFCVAKRHIRALMAPSPDPCQMSPNSARPAAGSGGVPHGHPITLC
jgi:hypothetical protein